MGEKYDFGGIATMYGTRCADGLTIHKGAFDECDGQKVPLVWNHQHDDIKNVLGHAVLENRGNDIYAHCKFNDTPEGQRGRDPCKQRSGSSVHLCKQSYQERQERYAWCDQRSESCTCGS